MINPTYIYDSILDIVPNAYFSMSLNKLKKNFYGNSFIARRQGDNVLIREYFRGMEANMYNTRKDFGIYNGYIRSISDHTGNNRSGIQNTDAYQPIAYDGSILGFNKIGNHYAVKFEGTTQIIEYGAAPAQASTAAVVFQTAYNQTATAGIFATTLTFPNNSMSLRFRSDNILTIITEMDNGQLLAYDILNLVLNKPYMVILRFDFNRTIDVTINQGSTVAFDFPGFFYVNPSNIRVGTNRFAPGSSTHFKGLISEFLWYSRYLNSTELELVRDFFVRRYNLV